MKSQKPLENKSHMSKTLAELKEKASRLSEVERAELALSLIESLDGPPDEGADAAWRVEIERRIGQIERGEVELIPGEEVFARLRRRLG
jgi:putative addiction module component (TIGR02574 family)